jgi:hypothetical protein
MNKIITTAFAAASLLVGSAFAAQTGKMDAKTAPATTDAKTTVVKKHHKAKKHIKNTATVAPAATTAPVK